jgi:hypothetical protein
MRTIARQFLVLLAIAQPSLADEPPRTDATRKLMMMVETNVIRGKKLKGPPEAFDNRLKREQAAETSAQ